MGSRPSQVAGWFGADVPLLGIWQIPSGGRATGAVVLCPPLGREHNVAYRAYRLLAERLAESGVAALRFAYAGTGDSGEVLRGRRPLDQWCGDVRAAVAEARSAGAEHVTVLGLRAGALIAAHAVAEGVGAGVDAFIAWDPYRSGRAFLRHERALRLMTLRHVPESAPEGGFEGVAFVYGPEVVEDVSPLRLVAPPVPTLELVRDTSAGAPDDDGLVTRVVAPDAAELMAAPDQFAQLPLAGIETIVAWVAEQTAHSPAREIAPSVRAEAVIEHGGTRVREQVLTVGPRRLFAVVSSGGDEQLGPVVLATTADHVHSGVARFAVDAARDLAARGGIAVRYDAEDLGDSPGGTTVDGPVYYTPERVRDVEEMARWCAERTGRPAAVVGLCSGAWAALMAMQSTPVSAVYLLNPIVWTRKATPMGPAMGFAAPTWRTEIVKRAAQVYRRSQESRVLRAITGFLWHVLALLRWRVLATLRLTDSANRLLDGPAARQVPITLVLSPREQEVLVDRSTIGGVRALRGRRHLRFVDTDIEDHSLLSVALRDLVVGNLPGWVATDLGPVTTGPASVPGSVA